jgi:hypothetical protein
MANHNDRLATNGDGVGLVAVTTAPISRSSGPRCVRLSADSAQFEASLIALAA